jgi:hypothetical protein
MLSSYDEISRPSTSSSEICPTPHNIIQSTETPRNKRKRGADQPHDLLRKATSALQKVADSSVEDHLDAFGT